MKHKSLARVLLSLVLILMLTAFGAAYAEEIPATELTMTVGEETTLMEAGDVLPIWQSSNEAVAAVSEEGVVTAISAGSTVVTAQFPAQTFTWNITVGVPVISKASVTLTTGVQQHLTLSDASGAPIDDAEIEWKSTDASVATISAGGWITAKKVGSATISGEYCGTKLSCKVTVKDPYLSQKTMTCTTKTQTHLIMKYCGGSTISDSGITWMSSDESIATVSAGGWVTGVKAGSATITGNFRGKELSCKVTVKDPYLSQETMTATIETQYHLKMKYCGGSEIADSNITWTSSNKSIATVSKNGWVKGIKAGTATITGDFRGKKLSCTVTVKDPYLLTTKTTLPTGVKYHVTMKYGNGNTIDDSNIKWSSSNKSVATVSEYGWITAVKAGSATITGNYRGYQLTCQVTVKTPYLSQTSAKIPTGPGVQLYLKYGDKYAIAGDNASWKSANTGIATVSSSGYIKGVKTGTTTITATYKGKSYKCSVTVFQSKISLNKSNLTFTSDKDQYVTVTYTGTGSIAFECNMEDRVVLCDWMHEWNGNAIKLKISPFSCGSVIVKIYDVDNPSDYKIINVRVKFLAWSNNHDFYVDSRRGKNQVYIEDATCSSSYSESSGGTITVTFSGEVTYLAQNKYTNLYLTAELCERYRDADSKVLDYFTVYLGKLKQGDTFHVTQTIATGLPAPEDGYYVNCWNALLSE